LAGNLVPPEHSLEEEGTKILGGYILVPVFLESDEFNGPRRGPHRELVGQLGTASRQKGHAQGDITLEEDAHFDREDVVTT
jgi:hypothetical protein